MKTSRFTDSQILPILNQAEGGLPVPELCRELGLGRYHPQTEVGHGGLTSTFAASYKRGDYPCNCVFAS